MEEVELDETWVGGPQAGIRGSRQLRGRKAALVLVGVERHGRGSGRVRMKVTSDFTGATMRDFVARNVTVGTTVYTDGFKSFEGLTAAGYKHVPRTQPIRVRLLQGARSVVPLAQLLNQLDYSFQSNRKTEDGNDHAVRDAQFRHINAQVGWDTGAVLVGDGELLFPTPSGCGRRCLNPCLSPFPVSPSLIPDGEISPVRLETRACPIAAFPHETPA